ncbi:hypothetical protein QCA50_014511 [Cerrena zonata]|uniref:Uncharacterized protein n=1 Tax=Cerrena zonata TaxID=2478898 RepID=A0AAW0FXH5_9APHY
MYTLLLDLPPYPRIALPKLFGSDFKVLSRHCWNTCQILSSPGNFVSLAGWPHLTYQPVQLRPAFPMPTGRTNVRWKHTAHGSDEPYAFVKYSMFTSTTDIGTGEMGTLKMMGVVMPASTLMGPAGR